MTGKFLVSIVGPTAVGKSKVAAALAKHYSSVVISADSRQFYREMTIGTAIPSPEEQAGVPHFFIQHKSIDEEYNVGDFESDVMALLERLFRKHQVVFMAGGSGLYVNAVRKGLDQFPAIDPRIRGELNEMFAKQGLQGLQDLLKGKDPGYFEQVDLANPHRVIRALEVCIGTGRPYSSFLTRTSKQRFFKNVTVGLQAGREQLYRRIEERVDRMMRLGLLDEVKSLTGRQELQALQTVGYSELFRYLKGDGTLESAVAEIKKNSRRYAKRQLTWFKKDPDILWVPWDTPVEELILLLKSKHIG